MNSISKSFLFAFLSLGFAVVYHLLAPAEYTRVGLLAGLAAGLVFTISTPKEERVDDRVRRVIRSALAFGVTTGVGYWFYQGPTIGISWGVGGTLGCLAGGFTGQVGRVLFFKEPLNGD